MKMFRKIILKLIRVYQKTISRDHGLLKSPYGFCRFYPTCSQYTYEAIDQYGAPKGLLLGLKRVFRCRPFSPGGYDPIKNIEEKNV